LEHTAEVDEGVGVLEAARDGEQYAEFEGRLGRR
jgi:hypothetical protein